MDTDQVMDMVNLLDDQVDDIEEALAPLLKSTLQDIAAKLPVVDKARLYVLTTYAIDSLLFSYLRLHGVNAREHPVMRELERVKQYVRKINEAQGTITEAKREVTLNKEVAARFVKHDLAGNDQWDREHAAEKIREKAAAHAKFEALSRKIERRKAEEEEEEEVEEVEEEEEGGVEVEEENAGKQGSGSGSDEENLQDKYKDEPVLDIIDTEDEKKAKSEEQVNRILDTFRNHGVVANPASKRKFDHEAATNAEEEAKRKKIAKKERRKLKTSKKAAEAENRARNGEEEPPKKHRKGHRKRHEGRQDTKGTVS